MSEPSDGIAEEVERQLQLALAAAAVAARRAIAARQHQLEQAQRESAQTTQAVRAQIEAERQLAAAHLQPVFEPGWWETAAPADVADMWQQANSWRDPDRDMSTPTLFDRAAGRIRHEVEDRTGLEVTQVLALAVVQELEREHQTTPAAEPDLAHHPAQSETGQRNSPAPRAFDDPQRRERLRERLAALGVPEQAIDARTLADVGQAREPAEATNTPAGATARPRPAGGRSAHSELRRQR
jgi:hypothetical protein